MWNVTIYGTNTNLNQVTPLISTLQGLSDVQYQTFQILGLWAEVKNEGDEVEYFDGTTTKLNTLRTTFKVVLAPSLFGSGNLDDFYRNTLFRKKYLFLDFGTFPYRLSYVSSKRALWVTLREIRTEFKNGFRLITLELSEARPNE